MSIEGTHVPVDRIEECGHEFPPQSRAMDINLLHIKPQLMERSIIVRTEHGVEQDLDWTLKGLSTRRDYGSNTKLIMHIKGTSKLAISKIGTRKFSAG